MSVVLVEVAAPNDLDAAFQTFAHERTQAVIVLHDSLFFSEHRRIVTLAAAGRLPTIWTTREFAEDGGLITYGLDEADSFRRAAGYLVKILRGARAGDLPIELPVKFELVINLKTGVKRAAVLRDPTNPAGSGQWGAIQSVAPSFGVELSAVNMRSD